MRSSSHTSPCIALRSTWQHSTHSAPHPSIRGLALTYDYRGYYNMFAKLKNAQVVSRGSDGRGGDGAGSSGGRLAAQVAGIDIGAVTERVTSEQSAARSASFAGGPAGVNQEEGQGQEEERGPAEDGAQPQMREGASCHFGGYTPEARPRGDVAAATSHELLRPQPTSRPLRAGADSRAP